MEAQTISPPSLFQVFNPILNKAIYTLEESSRETTLKTFENARNTAIQVASLSVKERIQEIYKIRDYIIQNKETLIDQIIQETGKSRFDALTSEIFEIVDVIDVVSKTAEQHLQDEKVSTPLVLLGKTSKVVYQPLGVVLVITPWNYPLYQMLVPSIYAFIAGNAVLIKPSEATPLKGLVEKMLIECGFIKGAIQVVYGGKETGKQLIDQKPHKIHFTGSTRAGKEIMKQAAEYLIPVDLELGGKDASIVFEDVNLERTVNGVMWGALTTGGQSCTSIERLYVHASIYDAFVSMLVDKTKKLRTPTSNSDITQPDSYDVGCIVTERQLNTIDQHVKDAVQKGAKVLCGGQKKEGLNCYLPTVLVDVTDDMLVMVDETFGPVIPVVKFTSEQEVIQKANNSIYGLSASVWSKDLKRAERVAKALNVGNVSINSHMITEANPNLPFGGTKQSGIGRYKGKWGFHTFSNIKSIVIDKQSAIIEAHWYPFTKTKYAMLNTVLYHLLSGKKNWLKVASAALQLDSIGRKEQIK